VTEPSAAPPTLDRARVRAFVVDTNDGIVATAGIAEGLLGAGAETTSVLVAALAAMVAGAAALAGARYNEMAIERDAQLVLVDEQRRQLARSPDEELTDLVKLWEAKGLSPALAHEVADELSRADALAAHVEAEHGFELEDVAVRPVVIAAASALAFALGSTLVLLTVLLTPDDWRVPVTFLTVAISLSLTSIILARWGNLPVARTIARTLTLGLGAMLMTLLIGSLFDL
jgi:VIT1/CCC1 family predicted Fe2+/Mn2+ transporter